MKIPDNTLNSAANYFKDELNGLYGASELQQMLDIVFAHYFNINKVEMITNNSKLLSESDLLKVIYTVKALKKYKPLAYILGEWEFYGLSLKLNEHTLIPRPETEELVQLIIEDNPDKKNINILDIGTGSGCIALGIKKYMPDAQVYAWDVSQKALEVAIENAGKNNLKINFEEIDILKEDLISPKKLHVIVSNPPYITQQEKTLMHENVLNYEPHLALFVEGHDPLIFYSTIADFALKCLMKRGKLYFEINENYGEEIKQLLTGKGFSEIEVIKDMNGKDRIVKAILE